jgi:hypothetical protein
MLWMAEGMLRARQQSVLDICAGKRDISVWAVLDLNQ